MRRKRAEEFLKQRKGKRNTNTERKESKAGKKGMRGKDRRRKQK